MSKHDKDTVRQIGYEPKDPLDFAAALRDQDVNTMVRNSLAADGACLAFQPIVTAQGQGKTAFYEGLIRVRDRLGRVIPAYQFMSDIEETELGREIDCASLRLGIQKLHEVPQLRLAINMSARSIADGKWRDELERGVRHNPAVAGRLILEISESSAMNLPEVMIRFMAEMQPLGVCFALDDFGAGMTSFRHLKDFFFDFVKIDKCFVRDIDENPDNQVLAEALISVAHQFEMYAVAEGVETRAEAEMLKHLNIDCLQGYLISVPKFTL